MWRNVTELVRDMRDTPTSTMNRTKAGTNDNDSCSSIAIWEYNTNFFSSGEWIAE